MTKRTKELLRQYAEKYERAFPSPDPSEFLQTAEGASHDLDPPGLEGLCQRFIKGLEPVTGGKSALVVKRDVKGQKSDFHGVDLLAFF